MENRPHMSGDQSQTEGGISGFCPSSPPGKGCWKESKLLPSLKFELLPEEPEESRESCTNRL